MCGIAGIVAYEPGKPTLAPRVEAMRSALRHRGPDGEASFHGQFVSLAHTRLALLDASGGAQPMHSADGRYVLVYNGEVYNLDELRAELRPHWTFHTRSDAELVLAAFAHWGERCVTRLDGMFAFFVWDTLREVGFAARDLLGIKPFVFAHEGGEFAFASEAKALLAQRSTPPRANLEALLEYFAAPCFSGVEAPLFEGMSYLPAGHFLWISRDGLRCQRWGRYELSSEQFSSSPSLEEELREALLSSVRASLLADVPVGLLLSGGLDSTLLAACARKAGNQPACFTIAFEEEEHFAFDRSLIVVSRDEPFAALAATELELTRVRVPAQRTQLADELRLLAEQNDALPAWEQELSQHTLFRAIGSRAKAVLVGDAADETHYGYHFLLDPRATERPRNLLERFADPPLQKHLLSDPLEHFSSQYTALARNAGHRFDTPLERTLATTRLIVERWLPRLLHNGDVHAMAHGVEARVPFAALPVLALAQRVSPARALANGVEKSVLRGAARGLLSEPLRTRRKSALPKDLLAGPTLQRETARAIQEAGDLLSPVLELDRLTSLLAPERALHEREQALLFRVVCLAHWARFYEVRIA